MDTPPARARCVQHGLLYDPSEREGCTICRRSRVGEHLQGSLSWIRVVGLVGVVLVALLLAWRFSPLSRWAEEQTRAALGRGVAPTETPLDLDPALWEKAVAQWEPFTAGSDVAQRGQALQITSYVPGDNLANLEDRVTGRRPDRSDVLDGLRGLDAVLLRYPERFVRATGFERILWMRDIVKDGEPALGFALPAARTMVFDPSAFEPAIFDHEIYHLVDYRLHGASDDQPAWGALNPKGANYIGVEPYGRRLRRGGGLGQDSPHFITDYARTTAREDRAETFRVLMADPTLARKRRRESAVIEQKAQYILDALDRLASGSSTALGLR